MPGGEDDIRALRDSAGAAAGPDEVAILVMQQSTPDEGQS